MDAMRCKKCGCIHSEDKVICPTCGAKNRSSRMFEDTTCGLFSFMESESPCRVLKNKDKNEENSMKNRRRRRTLFLILFPFVAIPLKAIFDLAKEYSGKK